MPKFFGRFSTSDCKTQAQLCMGRIRLMRNKKQIAMAQTRKEVAELLRANKQENARIRVESVIRDINMLQAYDVLEIFLEMLVQRLQLIDKCKDVPTDMFESLASLIYSASRVQDFPELGKIRDMLGRKFGQEFVEKCSADSTCRQFMVNENLIQFLAINAPDPDLKLQVLSDIAQQHDVEWDSHRAHQEMLSGGYKSFGGRPASLGPPPSGGPPGGPGGFPGPSGGPGGFQGPPGNFGGGGGGGGGGGMGIVQPPSPLFQPPPTEFSGPPPAQNQPSESKFQKNLKRVVTLGRKSQGGNEEWTDASSAAAAAREYSQNAQKAADAAHRYANPEGGYTNVQPSQGSNSEMVPPNLPQYRATSPAAPQYPNLAQQPANDLPAPQGPQPGGAPSPGQGPHDFNPMTKSLQQNPGNESQPSKQNPLPPGQYRHRSDEDIQRAYDAAGGPPPKKGAPSAPPPQPTNLDDTLGSLPSPPEPTLKKGGGSGGIDDDLAARFEALKKG